MNVKNDILKQRTKKNQIQRSHWGTIKTIYSIDDYVDP